jgi:hypothetical protein
MIYEHLLEKQPMIEETRNLVHTIACSNHKKTFKSKGGEQVSSFFIDKDNVDCPKLISNLNHLYHDCGMGFKLLSSQLGNISYTRLRTIFKALGIEKRNGKSCITEGLKKIRSERAKKSNPWTNWNEKYPDKDKVNSHHLGGWYFNKSSNKHVWLRSSWEYGYASWLDSQAFVWDVEIRSYLLSDGRYYRPDFFIFSNDCLSYIVEIKSKWANGSLERIDKFEKFKQEYPNIKALLVSDELFAIIGRTQSQVLAEWKTKRILELTNE